MQQQLIDNRSYNKDQLQNIKNKLLIILHQLVQQSDAVRQSHQSQTDKLNAIIIQQQEKINQLQRQRYKQRQRQKYVNQQLLTKRVKKKQEQNIGCQEKTKKKKIKRYYCNKSNDNHNHKDNHKDNHKEEGIKIKGKHIRSQSNHTMKILLKSNRKSLGKMTQLGLQGNNTTINDNNNNNKGINNKNRLSLVQRSQNLTITNNRYSLHALNTNDQTTNTNNTKKIIDGQLTKRLSISSSNKRSSISSSNKKVINVSKSKRQPTINMKKNKQNHIHQHHNQAYQLKTTRHVINQQNKNNGKKCINIVIPVKVISVSTQNRVR